MTVVPFPQQSPKQLNLKQSIEFFDWLAKEGRRKPKPQTILKRQCPNCTRLGALHERGSINRYGVHTLVCEYCGSTYYVRYTGIELVSRQERPFAGRWPRRAEE